ncbi:MAG: phosphate/phosphite/phosphonate ABC transporter substrate-binding protein [Deltaproteobacteria bacterium]|nr:phosphate/phosphite/phosphonate ABC transporter substrate-binding protein [Deltaproteobacteria bacterium]NIS76774.1 phosphate/phosphite/phosphonate ABC transporter substrate-binding protein [Deltaproteobacteria bacterium]
MDVVKLVRKFLLIALSLCVAISTGCERDEKITPKAAKAAGKMEATATVTIGLIPEHNIFRQMERFKPLAKYLAERTGLKIELKILSRYGNIISNFVSMNLDGAFFGSFTYTLAHSKIGLEVMARPESPEGTSTYYGLLFVRKDSGLKEGRDMRGKRFAFVDKATTAGYLLPLDYFKSQGINDYKAYFSETYFTGTHENAIYDVLNKKADVGAAKNTVFYRIAKEDPRILKELAILFRSPDVPENALALRKDLPDTVKQRIKSALLAMSDDPEGARVLGSFGAGRFIETTDQDYAAVFTYAEKIGLDLATHDYIND